MSPFPPCRKEQTIGTTQRTHSIGHMVVTLVPTRVVSLTKVKSFYTIVDQNYFIIKTLYKDRNSHFSTSGMENPKVKTRTDYSYSQK